MQYLKQSTATTVVLGPFLDENDGKTAETALTVASIDCDIYKGVTKTDLTLTASGGSNDCVHIANGYYSLELTATDVDTLGRFMITANISAALPVFEEFSILPANVYDSLFGSDRLQVDVREMGDSTLDFTTTMQTRIQTECNYALVTNGLDHLIQTSPGSTKPALGSYLDQMMNKDGSQTFDPTADSLEAIRDNMAGVDTAAIADAVLDELITDSVHNTPDSLGARLHAIFAAHFNKQTVTASQIVTYKDDASTVLETNSLSDNGTTVTRT